MIILYSSLFLATVLGIYIFPQLGLRTDHLLIYPLFFINFLLFFVNFRSLKLNSYISLIIILLFAILLIGSTSLILGNFSGSIYKFIAQFENLFQPLALILITCTVVKEFSEKYSTSEIIIFFIKLYLLFLIINTMLAVIFLYVGSGQYLELIGGPPDVDGKTAIGRALPAGRSPGVFNQPFDAGVAYSIGLFCWVYLINIDSYKHRKILYFSFPFLIAGSFFSGSKVVQFLGSILFIIYLLVSSKIMSVFLNYRIIFISILSFIILYILLINFEMSIPLFRTMQYFIINRF